MELHPKLRSRLIQLTTNAIPKIKVAKGSYVQADAADFLTAGDVALPNEVRKELTQTISDHPFSAFVVAHVDDLLRPTAKWEDVEPSPLLGRPGFEIAEGVATQAVDTFATLPWHYTIIYPLPLKSSEDGEQAPAADKTYAVAPNLSLVKPGAKFNETYPSRKTAATLRDIIMEKLEAQPTSWPAGNLYLLHTTDGYITDSFTSKSAKTARLLLRTFGGILEASGLAQYRYTPRLQYEYWGSAAFQPLDWIYTYRGHEDGWRPAPSVKVDGEHAERLNSLRWGVVPEIPGNWDPWTEAVASHLRPAFADTEGAALLRRCAQWHFDSQCGSNHLLQFVQATVAIEILLGDKATSDVVGLGELLANRCAYSLAKTPGERLQLLKSFKELYATRSSIVHSGKPDLSERELDQLYELMFIGRRLIHNELKLMHGK